MNISPGILNTLAVFGIVLSVVSLLYAVFLAYRSNRSKVLIYDITEVLAIASVLPNQIGHRLSIIYEREGEEPVNVKGAYIKFVRIGNVGREPIRREDIAPIDPLRIEIRNARVLDLAVDGVSRETINFSIEPYREQDGVTVASFKFDFLDQFDGVLFRVLTDERKPKISICGTIIGMPKIRCSNPEDRMVKSMGVSCLAIFCGLLVTFLFLFTTGALIPRSNNNHVAELTWYQNGAFFVAFWDFR